ncbi:hypothetical protein 2F1_5 [Uncultured Caudovirales phage clone 2F_1]|uniref:Uncharacterized protein n=1 Tax=Uncultured Caudovirales phage clone 2F_1 TaxID=2992576 RepID=A0A2H4JF99_9CAUD|nr:hypothetical protein [Acinetobacter radioresistens]YP_010092433.1 hypothetical protein KNT73_gp05 [Uncultured Caudovirales phage clone 2F_1]ASN71606.1 hypothetical protein 2F1_5 [Uncultured Caudovirales phage clone 2F_1]RJL74403.1 hypothetical protein D5055_02700 [Acinetobacter radioresistens]
MQSDSNLDTLLLKQFKTVMANDLTSLDWDEELEMFTDPNTQISWLTFLNTLDFYWSFKGKTVQDFPANYILIRKELSDIEAQKLAEEKVRRISKKIDMKYGFKAEHIQEKKAQLIRVETNFIKKTHRDVVEQWSNIHE